MADLPDTFDGPVHIAIIGGTGLSHLPTFTPVARLPLSHPSLQTPWGAPSSPITILSHPRRLTASSSSSSSSSAQASSPLNVAFLSRHGLHHELAPHQVPSRANIAALRKLGVRCVVAFSAVGSLREEVKPRDFLVPDQVIDRTKGVRPWTYFEDGVVGHIGFADPFDNALRAVVINAVQGKGILEGEAVRLHEKGTLICMEGPQFSTRAESQLYRSWSGSCINMSCLPEAKLAREAELAYAMICMSTDYDSWHGTNETVSVEMVMGHMAANAENAKHVVAAVLDALGEEDGDVDVDGEGGKGAAGMRAVALGREWEGQTRFAAGMTKGEGRRAETVEKLSWLFPGYF